MRADQLAINSVSTVRCPLEECLAGYHAAGFRNVEFTLGHVKPYLEAGHTVAELKGLLDRYRLQCIGGFEGGLEAFSAAEGQAASQARIVENCRLLSELGASALVVGTDGPGPDFSGDPLDRLAEAFAELATKTAPLGVQVCLEFNWSPLVKSFRTAAEVVRRAGHQGLGVLFDPAHYHCTPSKFEQLTPENVATIGHIHVDDMADKPGELSNCNADRRLPGEGCLDLGAIFGRIESLGYEGYFSIEMFDEALWSLPAAEAAGRMYASLQTLLSD